VHFLFSFLQAILEREAPQAAQKNINLGILRNLEVPLPPYLLQKEFDSIVKKAMGVFDGQNRSLQLIQEEFSSLQQRAFRGELDLSRLTLPDQDELQTITPIPDTPKSGGRFKRPGSFTAPPEIEAEMVTLEEKLEYGPGDSIPWSEDFFKYRILSQALTPPFSFSEIWEAVRYDMEDANYEDVKAKVFEYIEIGILEQQFDMNRKEIVFYPRP
jgi:type I restriction enzyme, S subunit